MIESSNYYLTDAIWYYSKDICDHTMGDWEITTNPTCEANGEETRTCVNGCGYIETQAVSATGHDMGEWVTTTEPSCEAVGEETRTCVNDCGYIETQTVSATGHDMGEWVTTTEPSCEANGEETRTCVNGCGYIETQVIPNVHSYDNDADMVCNICDEAKSILEYEIIDGEVSITSFLSSSSAALTIPNTIKGFPVTSISDYAFQYCYSLASIDIPLGVKSIGSNVFNNCNKLADVYYGGTILNRENISIADSNKYLYYASWHYLDTGCKHNYDSSADMVCNSCSEVRDILEYYIYKGNVYIDKLDESFIGDIVIPATIECCPVTVINSKAFSNCYLLTSINIPNSVTEIRDYAFEACEELTSVVMPDNITFINEGTFYYCSSLENISIPSRVTGIGDFAFEGCELLLDINISNNITSIGEGAFRFCKLLQTVTIPNSVLTIGNYAFAGCKDLETVKISNGLTEICEGVFQDCSSLVDVYIPNSITSINYCAFGWCSSLTNVYYSGIQEDSSNIWIYDGNTNLTDAIWHYCDHKYDNNADMVCNSCGTVKTVLSYKRVDNAYIQITDLVEEFEGSITIPATIDGYPVKSIGNRAFSGTYITNIELPSCITAIGPYAFYGCSNLTNIEFPDDITTICPYTFAYCSSLTKIEIPDNIKTIGQGAFEYCSSLTSIYIPDSVTNIGASAFTHCYSIDSIEIDENNTYYSSESNCLIEKSTQTLLTGCKNSVIPEGVTTIGQYAFSGCPITSIYIPDGVTTIDAYAFLGCNSLKTVYLPSSIANINFCAFDSCNSVTDVYYRGYNIDKLKINIDTANYGNLDLTNATWHCNICAHEWGEWRITQHPTWKSEGVKVRTCAIQGCSETEILPKAEISSIKVSKNPDKIVYIQNQEQGSVEFDPTGMELTVYYTDTETPCTLITDISEINFSEISIFDAGHDQEYTFTFAETEVSVFIDIVINGDLNGDNILSNEDCDIIINYVLGETEEISSNADINGDGVINLKDAILFKQKCAGYNVKYFI